MIAEPQAQLYADRWDLADEIRRYLVLRGAYGLPRGSRSIWAFLAERLIDSLLLPSRDYPHDIAEKLNRHLLRRGLRKRYTYLALVCDWILEGNVPDLPTGSTWPPLPVGDAKKGEAT